MHTVYCLLPVHSFWILGNLCPFYLSDSTHTYFNDNWLDSYDYKRPNKRTFDTFRGIAVSVIGCHAWKICRVEKNKYVCTQTWVFIYMIYKYLQIKLYIYMFIHRLVL